MLGFNYAHGEGVPQDDAQAAVWYRKAAEQGNAGAQYALGSVHREGKGVPKVYAEAVRWFRKAAEQGHADGQYGLGLSYSRGEGVPRDYVQAHMWISLAEAQASVDLKLDCLRELDLVAKEMTPQQIAEARRLAAAWKPRPKPPLPSACSDQQ